MPTSYNNARCAPVTVAATDPTREARPETLLDAEAQRAIVAMRGDEARIRAAGCAGHIDEPLSYRECSDDYLDAGGSTTNQSPSVSFDVTPVAAHHRARILIVDDDPQNRHLLEIMLAPEGYVLQTAARGEAALAMVAKQPPDLILLDIMMPGIDGYEVAGTLKGNLATRHIFFIMITALGDDQTRRRGLRAGAEDVITKPVDQTKLCLQVKNLLHTRA